MRIKLDQVGWAVPGHVGRAGRCWVGGPRREEATQRDWGEYSRLL